MDAHPETSSANHPSLAVSGVGDMARVRRLGATAILIASCCFVGVARADGSDSSSSSSTSTGSDGIAPRQPRISHSAYAWIETLAEFVLWIILAWIVHQLPMSLLTRISARLFGFEHTQQLYKTNRPHAEMAPLMPTAMSDTPSTHLLGGHARDDESFGSILSSAHPDEQLTLLNVVMRSSHRSAMIMGRQIDFDEDEMEAAVDETIREDTPWYHRIWHGFVSALTGQCFERGCCHRIPAHRAFRIRRYIRQLLLWSSFVACALFLSTTIVIEGAWQVPAGSTMCPEEVQTNSNPFDCFLLSRSKWSLADPQNTFIDCRLPLPAWYDNTIDQDIACMRPLVPSAAVYLTQISTVAALFTLVMAGSATVLGWLLGRLTRRSSVRWVYAIPISLGLIFVVCTILRWFATPLSIFAFIAGVSITTLTTKVRMAIGFDEQETRGAEMDGGGRSEQLQQPPPPMCQTHEVHLPRSLSVQATQSALQMSYRDGMDV